VIEYSTYYVGVETPKIRVTRDAPTTTTTTATTTTTTTSTTAVDESTYFPVEKEESNSGKNATDGPTTPANLNDTTTTLTEKGGVDSATNSTEVSSTSTTSTTTASTTTTTTTTTTATTTTTEKPKIIDAENEIYEGCSSTKACFGMPVGCTQDKSCNAIVSYELNGDKMLFKMHGFPYHDSLPGGSEGYLSLGLSPGDPYMGNDLTTTCYYDQTTSKVKYQEGYNTKGRKENKKLDDQKTYINNFEGSYKDGLLSCQFRRPENVKVVHEDTVLNINLFSDKFAILLAKGRVKSGERLQQHYEKVATSEAKSLGLTENLEAKSNILYRLHGAFMIAAWIFTASLGTILARYFKNTWTHMKCLGKDVWFPCHVSLMTLTWVLTLTAFILIFVELNFEWTSIKFDVNPHALLGCITTGEL
jgi:hypothetical protein